MDDTPPDVVRVRAGRTAEKRRSWHVARVSSDIQRSLADQIPVDQPRSSPRPNDDWSLSYQHGSGWTTTTTDSGANSNQVDNRKATFTITSWVDRPAPKEMDTLVARLSSRPTKVQPESSSSDSSDEDVQPVVVLPVTIVNTQVTELEESNNLHKRLVSTLSDTYIDVVVKELRGATPCSVSLLLISTLFFPPSTYFHT